MFLNDSTKWYWFRLTHGDILKILIEKKETPTDKLSSNTGEMTLCYCHHLSADPKIDVHVCLLSYVEKKERNCQYVEIIPHVRRNIKLHLQPRHEYNFE